LLYTCDNVSNPESCTTQGWPSFVSLLSLEWDETADIVIADIQLDEPDFAEVGTHRLELVITHSDTDRTTFTNVFITVIVDEEPQVVDVVDVIDGVDVVDLDDTDGRLVNDGYVPLLPQVVDVDDTDGILV